MRNVLVAATMAATMGAVAQNTFVFDPAEGETLTVATRLTGATNVVANSGASGGGIVQLLARYSDYTGVTSNNCGTLWPSFIGPGSEYGSLGGTGMICLGKGTLKYAGQAGAINAPVVHTGGADDYTVYDIGEGSDLSLTGPVTLDTRLVKRGTGTLRFAREGTSSFFLQGGTAATPNHINGCYRINFNDNGDAPTQGGSGITVAEGTVSFDKGTYTLGSAGYPLCIGAYTAADNEQETSGIVDIRGASVTISSDVNLGVFNGFTSTTPDDRPSSAFRIYSGTITLPSSVWFGRCYYDPTAGKTMNSNPRFEMHGGTASCSQIVTFQMGNLPGLLSEFTVDGGSLAVNYFVPSLNLFPGISTGSYKGDATSTNLITIGGTGVVDFSRIQNNSGEITYVRLNDEGVFKTCFLNNSSGWMALDFNGGTLLQNRSSDFALISNNMSRVTVGTKGGVIGATGSFVAHVQKGIVPFPGLEGTDGGVTISNAAATGVVRLYGVNTYAGPTTVKTGAIELVGDGLLSPNSRLILTGGIIVVTNRQQTVAGFTLGQTASGTTEEFRFTKTMPLIVTADIKLKGSPELTIVPLESDGSVSTTVGDYTVMIAPIAQKQMLEAMTVRCKAPNLSSEFFNVVEDGDNVKLVIQTTDPGLDPVDPNYGYWTNPAGGEWMTATNWEDGNIAESYDMHALFLTAAQDGGATVSVPAAGVELESLEATAGSYIFDSGSLKPMRIDLHANADFEFSGGAHEIFGNVYVGGGTANAMPKFAVSGGSLTCDNLFMKYDPTESNMESPTVEISGGVVTAKTSVVMSYHAGAGTNTFTMTGGKLVTPSFKVGGSGGTTATRPKTAQLSFTNCEIDLGSGTFDRDASNELAKQVTFGPGSVIRAKRIE